MKTPPRLGSKKYKEIVSGGCFGKYDYYGEFYCEAEYPWECEHCPVVISQEEEPKRWTEIEIATPIIRRK